MLKPLDNSKYICYNKSTTKKAHTPAAKQGGVHHTKTDRAKTQSAIYIIPRIAAAVKPRGAERENTMMYYNYREAMKADILQYIRENYTADEIREKLEEREEWRAELDDDLWVADSVTGNASGSYFFSAWKAEEAIAHNWDLLEEAMREFCDECNPIEKGAEWCDVTIRCYLLGECIAAVLDDLEDELEELDEGEEA